MGTISRGVIWVDGQYLTAADLNGELNIIHDEFNGNIDNANIKAAAAVAGSKIAPDFGQQAVTLEELAADPSTATNKGHLYTKDVSGATEVFYRDAAGNVVQLTSGGAVNAAGLSNLPGYIYDCVISPNSVSPTSKIDIATGALEVDVAAANDPEIIEVTSTLTMDFSTTGANGLDTGSPAINWYHVYVIYDPSGPTIASLSSLSATSPTLPGSYTKFRRVGSFYNTASGSASIRAFHQVGKGPNRRCTFAEQNVGSSLSSTSYASLSLSSVVPTTAVGVWGSAGNDGNGDILIRISHDGSVDGPQIGVPDTGGAQPQGSPFYIPLSVSQTIYYKVSGQTRTRVDIYGYEEEL